MRRHPEHLHSHVHTAPTSCKASPQNTTPATKVFLHFVRLTHASNNMITRTDTNTAYNQQCRPQLGSHNTPSSQTQHPNPTPQCCTVNEDSPKPLTPPQKTSQGSCQLLFPLPRPGSSATLPQYLFIAHATQSSCPACYGVISDPTHTQR